MVVEPRERSAWQPYRVALRPKPAEALVELVFSRQETTIVLELNWPSGLDDAKFDKFHLRAVRFVGSHPHAARLAALVEVAAFQRSGTGLRAEWLIGPDSLSDLAWPKLHSAHVAALVEGQVFVDLAILTGAAGGAKP